ncbi:hypothetical protein LCGC14_0276230 [marine sediment metagenome]|uniref:Uncharacterized protein n=1 Tax=marine sediment metagenome TaxID=412755 RepID=A0A0F9WIN6_9ZZZZ
MMCAAAFVGAIFGLALLSLWLKMVLNEPRPPPPMPIATTKEIMDLILGEESEESEEEEENGTTYVYTEGGVAKEAKPGTEMHRLIEQVVRRR